MTDQDVVERFAAIAECGKIRGPVSRRRKGETPDHWKPMFEWKVYDRYEVVRLIDLFFPYFGERRQEKAMLVLEKIGMARGRNEEQTECSHGHSLEGDNLWLDTKRHMKADGQEVTYTVRRCHRCRIEQAQARRERDKAPRRT